MKSYNKTYKVNLSSINVKSLRKNSTRNFDCIHELKVKSGSEFVSFWNQYTSILSRVEETIDYLNSMRLGKKEFQHHAFDLYAFIIQADVIVQAVNILAKILSIEKKLALIENSKECFGEAKIYNNLREFKFIKNFGDDNSFWKYFRSISTAHPNKTDIASKLFGNTNEIKPLHVSPYVMWNNSMINAMGLDGDIVITFYENEKTYFSSYITVDVSMIEKYIKKQLNFLISVSHQIKLLEKKRINTLRNTIIHSIDHFEGSISDYFSYLRQEFKRRYEPFSTQETSTNFSDYLCWLFETKFENEHSSSLLNDYRKWTMKKVQAFVNSMQKMDKDPIRKLTIWPENLAFIYNSDLLEKHRDQFKYFENIQYPLISPNEPYYQSEIEMELLRGIDKMIEDSVDLDMINYTIAAFDSKYSFDARLYGRLHAYVLYRFQLDEYEIDFSLNDWKITIQFACCFWMKIRKETRYIG